MGKELDVVKKNQEQINLVAAKLNAAINGDGLTGRGKVYFDEEKAKIEEVKEILKLKKIGWFRYKDGLDKLKNDIKHLISCLKLSNKTATELDATKRLLVLTLLTSLEFLASVIGYIADKKSSENEGRLLEIALLQQKVEQGLGVFFPERERIFNLNLSGLTEAYEKSYSTDYGRGCFGFFKLPIKYFFRQNSRKEELQFIEDVNSYLQAGGKELSPENKELMKLSALNLVRLKIDTEAWGEGSQLHRLIDARLSEVGYLRNNEISKNFITFCQERAICVPESLSSFYEDDLEIDALTF